MKTILAITSALLLGTTALAVAQTSSQTQGQSLSAPRSPANANRANVQRPVLIPQRETTGMGSREPDAPFLFDPASKAPQRNDPTITPFGPMNNIE